MLLVYFISVTLFSTFHIPVSIQGVQLKGFLYSNSLCMEILLTSVTPCGLRYSIISPKEHDARSGDFITPFEKFRVGWGYVFMFSFPNCFHFSIFSDCFWVLFNGISTSVDHLMPEGLNWFCFSVHVLGFRVWVLVIFYYIWLDFDEEVDFLWFGVFEEVL